MSKIEVSQVASTKAKGGKLTLYTMTNSSGAQVKLTDIGAAIVGITVPDKKGAMKDVALGYRNMDDYFYDGPASGKTVGRYANRIAKGRFTLDGKEYNLPINNGPNSLHGGPEGFSNLVWDSKTDGDKVVFNLSSPDGDEGYPGNLKAQVTYRWSDGNDLEITYKATTDAPTVINLTNHCYFNLSGHDAGSIHDHKLTIWAKNWLPTDETQIPTGIAPVAGTPMDFTTAKAIGRDIAADFEALKIGVGYDHCWMADGYKTEGSLIERLRKVALLEDPASGRSVEIYTTQPAAQVYTGNWLTGCPVSKSGYEYKNRDGVAIECQGAPDAPNQPALPSQRLDPGQEYSQQIVFSFRN